MRTAIQLAVEAGPWTELVDYVTEAERLGVNCCWVAEAWGGDAATPIAALSQHTDHMIFGSGILQVGARSAVNTAMVGLALQRITGDRFILGLGASGPQVLEGLHGVPFTRPLTRMRETIEVIRMAEAGERLTYKGQTIVLPRPDGEGTSLRLSLHSNGNPLQIYLASLSPRMLELTGEIADGWLGTSFIPEGSQSSLDALTVGAGRAGRTLADLELCQGAEVAFAEDPADLAGMVASRKPGLAFSLGGMGSATTNFYNDAYARQGYAEVAAESQSLWLDGHRDEAAAVIPDEMVLATTLMGTEEMVADRLLAWENVGIDQVRLYPAGSTLEERLATLGRALDLVRALGQATPPTLHPYTSSWNGLRSTTEEGPMNTKRNTAAIYVRRSAADERDADDSDKSGCGLLESDYQSDMISSISSGDIDSPIQTRRLGKTGAIIRSYSASLSPISPSTNRST